MEKIKKKCQKAQKSQCRKARASFFVDKNDIENEKAYIRGSDVRHIKKVLRLKKNDDLVLFDNMGCEFTARIISISDSVIETRIIEKRENLRKTKTELILGQCIPKLSKMDFIIQKCVEIGVTHIIPLVSVRTLITKTNHPSFEAKHKRWLKIAYEAVKQCRRGNIPEIEKPRSLLDFFSSYGLKKPRLSTRKFSKDQIHRFILSADLKDHSFNEIMKKYRHTTNTDMCQLEAKSSRIKIIMLIGPEGGFTKEEKKIAIDNGFEPVKISSNVLKVETASILGVGLMINEFE